MANKYGEITDDLRARAAAEAVARIKHEGISLTAAARLTAQDYGVHYNSVRGWVADFYPEAIPEPVIRIGDLERRAAAERAIARLRLGNGSIANG